MATILSFTHRVELLLKFLIGVVDAELLEAVNLKRFKSIKTWECLLDGTGLLALQAMQTANPA